MKKLYFIRHGLSETNAQGLFAGTTNTPLTDEGRQQAKKAGKAAKDLGIDLIVSSSLSRALETAEIFAKEIGYPVDKIKTNKLLMERHYGSLEGKPWAPGLDMPDDVETDDSLINRAQQALEWINSFEADDILVVSHGSLGRALRSLVNSNYTMDHHEGLNNAELVCWIEN